MVACNESGLGLLDVDASTLSRPSTRVSEAIACELRLTLRTSLSIRYRLTAMMPDAFDDAPGGGKTVHMADFMRSSERGELN